MRNTLMCDCMAWKLSKCHNQMFNRSQFILIYAQDTGLHFITSDVLNMLNRFKYGIHTVYLHCMNLYS